MDVGDDPQSCSRADVLRRRIAFHREKAEDLERLEGPRCRIAASNERLMVRRLERKLARAIERESHQASKPKRPRTLYELGLDERIVGRLGAKGILDVRQLRKWPRARLATIPQLSAISLARIEAALARWGWKLPELKPGEEIGEPVLPIVGEIEKAGVESGEKA